MTGQRDRTITWPHVLLGVAIAFLAISRLDGAQPALAAGTGSIAGTVSSAASHAPITGVEVCAVATVAELVGEPGEEEEVFETAGCATTGAGGTYTITGLAAGSYYIGFTAPPAAGSWVPQFYNAKQAAAEAEPVSVHASSATPGIDAEMQPGGEITGTVTSAATRAPLRLIAACPVALSGQPGAYPCAITDAGGAYIITGLPAGRYTVAFIDPLLKYETQYFNLKAALAEADSVLVSPPSATAGLNAQMNRHGAVLPGAGPPPAPPGALLPGLGAGSGHAPAGLAFAVLLHSVRIAVHRQRALVRLSCHASVPCRGSATLTATSSTTRHGTRSRRTLKLGSARYVIPAGRTATVAISLDAAARSLLSSRHGRLACQLTVVQQIPGPSRAVRRTVRLTAGKG